MSVRLAHAQIRFIVYKKLISPSGERIGLIFLIDESVRPELIEKEIISLNHIANMMITNSLQEQRNLHLMRVADRALRIDRMIRVVSEAESCADGLVNLLETLCHFHSADFGQVWRLAESDKTLIEIGRYQRDHQTEHAWQAIESLSVLENMTLDSIRRNKPHFIKLPQIGKFEETSDADVRTFSGHVFLPIWAHLQRFGISLAFVDNKVDLDAVVADIISLSDTIRPTLFRKIEDEKLRATLKQMEDERLGMTPNEINNDKPIPTQGPGPQFAINNNGRIIEERIQSPVTSDNNNDRIQQILPFLRQSAADLASRLSRNANAFPELARDVENYKKEIDMPMSNISWGMVWCLGVRLEAFGNAVERNTIGQLGPTLDDPVIASLNSLRFLHYPLIQATSEGVQLQEQADRLDLTKDEQKKLREVAIALAENFKTRRKPY